MFQISSVRMLKLMVLLSVMKYTNGDDYCNLKSCASQKHTMCLFPASTPGRHCGTDFLRLMNGETRKKILEAHNKNRNDFAGGKNKIFGKAKNMRQLYWDQELENIAQRQADQCNFDPGRCKDVPRFKVGQNLASKMVKADNAAPTADSFIAKFIPTKLDDFQQILSNFTIGDRKFTYDQFTQLVWAETYLVGCGLSKFTQGFTVYLLVCNYGPTGNVVGMPVYHKGPTCSECSNGTKCGLDSKYSNLCGDPNGPPTPTAGGNKDSENHVIDLSSSSFSNLKHWALTMYLILSVIIFSAS